jgi:hypothetical protein
LEIDDNRWLITDSPSVVTGGQQGDVAWLAVELCPVIHPHTQDARDVILKVRCLAALGLSDGLHGFRPSPSRFKHGTPNSRAADLDWFNTALRELTNFVRLSKPLTSALSMRLVILSACLVCGCYRIESKLRRRPNVKDEPRDVGDVGTGGNSVNSRSGCKFVQLLSSSIYSASALGNLFITSFHSVLLNVWLTFAAFRIFSHAASYPHAATVLCLTL